MEKKEFEVTYDVTFAGNIYVEAYTEAEAEHIAMKQIYDNLTHREGAWVDTIITDISEV